MEQKRERQRRLSEANAESILEYLPAPLAAGPVRLPRAGARLSRVKINASNGSELRDCRYGQFLHCLLRGSAHSAASLAFSHD